MDRRLDNIIRFITTDASHIKTVPTVDVTAQFIPDDTTEAGIARNFNASFLIMLSGQDHPLYAEASSYVRQSAYGYPWTETAAFYLDGMDAIRHELYDRCLEDREFDAALDALNGIVTDSANDNDRDKIIERFRDVFFPEGRGINSDREEMISRLRNKRTVVVTKTGSRIIDDPCKEILFTSNILLTVPLDTDNISHIAGGNAIKKRIADAMKEPQVYWYDHPIPLGVHPEHNEILHGLEGLDAAVGFEKDRGTVPLDARLSCALSVSVTHRGLHNTVREYIEAELRKEKNIRHLDIYVFTEVETERILNAVLIPAAEHYNISGDKGPLRQVFGVDGEYGRHYSFLKAISAFWHVLINSEIRATFKIDLDQVFPQKRLVEQCGMSAFEHLKSKLWGACGTDSDGRPVELGMIAGALVNGGDEETSVFTPDVKFPDDNLRPDELIFFSRLPQALSTEAEMMTRYDTGEIDGHKKCLQRIHVTGGTNGILVDSLRRHRPFTPTVIGRAEDQAYLLSVLFSGKRPLRYVHKDGLIMRHDKEAFAADAIKAAETGKLIGDYIRILMFSYYAAALPWPIETIKNNVDPFTGCFISRIPLTVVYLRFALKAASYYAACDEEGKTKGMEFIKTGSLRLRKAIMQFTKEPSGLRRIYEEEKRGWNYYYNILNRLEEGLLNREPYAMELRNRAKAIVSDAALLTGRRGP